MGGVTLDLAVTNGYGVLCSEGRALTVECSYHIHLRASDSILSHPDSVALQRQVSTKTPHVAHTGSHLQLQHQVTGFVTAGNNFSLQSFNLTFASQLLNRLRIRQTDRQTAVIDTDISIVHVLVFVVDIV